MIRLILVGFLAVCLVSLAAADDPRSDDPEPPVRLKKKVRPEKKSEDKPAPKKAEPKKKESDPPESGGPTEPEGDEKEILGRIDKNIRGATDRLGQKDAGEGTRQVQRDVVKDIDALIAHHRRQQQQQQDQPPNAGNSGGKKSKDGQRVDRSNRPRRDPKNRLGNLSSKPGQSPQANQDSNRGGAGKKDNDGPSKMAELYKEKWGHLPETVRLEMDAYSRERFMARYSDLLKQYYSTIAERGRRTEDKR